VVNSFLVPPKDGVAKLGYVSGSIRCRFRSLVDPKNPRADALGLASLAVGYGVGQPQRMSAGFAGHFFTAYLGWRLDRLALKDGLLFLFA
jgi:hypothetical protein